MGRFGISAYQNGENHGWNHVDRVGVACSCDATVHL